jgi:hypothetical protein
MANVVISVVERKIWNGIIAYTERQTAKRLTSMV